MTEGEGEEMAAERAAFWLRFRATGDPHEPAPRAALVEAARVDLAARLMELQVRYDLTAFELLSLLNEAMGRQLAAALTAEREGE